MLALYLPTSKVLPPTYANVFLHSQKIFAFALSGFPQTTARTFVWSQLIPVYNILELTCNVVLAHPKYVKAIKDKKTDKKVAKWIADLFKYDLVSGSIVPPADIRQLRGKASSDILSRMLENPSEKLTDVANFRTKGMRATDEEVLATVKSKSRACVHGHQRVVPVPKNSIPRAAEADRQTEYAVCAGELDSGWQALL